MWTALVHAAAMLQQPVLPAQDLVLYCAMTPPAAAAVEAGCHLLLYIQSCLACAHYPDVTRAAATASGDAEAVQMAVLAFVLWPDVAYFEGLLPHGSPHTLKVRGLKPQSCSCCTDIQQEPCHVS